MTLPGALPAGFKYTKDHEWLDIAGDRGKVGITDYAQQQLGDVVYVELPDVETYDTLVELGCDAIQGALTGMPAPLELLRELVSTGRIELDQA